MLQELKKKGDQGLGRSKGGLTTKIHVLSVNETTCLNYLLSSGNTGDCPVGTELLKSWHHPDTKAAIMDKAYGSKENMEVCSEKDWIFVVPPKTNAKNPWSFSKSIYKLRNKIERLFNKVKSGIYKI